MISLVIAILLFCATSVSAANPATHPLDPLSQAELASVVTVLKAAGHVDDQTRFVFLSLREPDKTAVLKWQPGAPTPREAFAIIKQGAQTFEAVVDLANPKLVSWREIKDVQPALLVFEELQNLNTVLRADPGWQAAMRKRGLNRFEKIECMPFSAGYFGIPEEEGHRLVRAECYDAGAAINYWGRPIEGVVATVDLNQRRVMKLVDTGVVPVPKEPAEYDAKSIATTRAPVNPIIVEQPKGADFAVNGSEVIGGTTGSFASGWIRDWVLSSRPSPSATRAVPARSCTRAISRTSSCPTWTRRPDGTSEHTWMRANTARASSRRA